MNVRAFACTFAAAALAVIITGCGSSSTGMSAADTSSAPVVSASTTDPGTAATVVVSAASPSSPAASPSRTRTTQAAAPVLRQTTQAPQPVHTTAQAQQPQGCYPRTSGGNCYKPGEYCPKADHGMTGIDGSGDAIKCVDNNGWRWERS